jgi:hypothetical protein
VEFDALTKIVDVEIV